MLQSTDSAAAELHQAPPAEITRLRAGQRALIRERSLSAAKTAGNPARFGLLVIAVDFSDRRLPANWTSTSLAPRLGGAGGQSLQQYFRVASQGRLELVPVTVPLVHLVGARRDYSDINLNGFSRSRRLATEAIRAVAETGFDLRLADMDGPDSLAGTADDDGFVDGVLILHADAGQENDPQGGLIQALQFFLEEPVRADGIGARMYAVASLSSGPGIWAHETAHLLGMEDRYDPLLPVTAGGGELAARGGMGIFSLMAAGAWGSGGGWGAALPDAYSLMQLGWCDARNVFLSPAGGDTLRPIVAGGSAHRVWTRGESGPEFFLLETRDPRAASPFDAALPSGQMLIMHIDESVPEGSFAEDGPQRWHLRAAVVEADGTEDLHVGLHPGSVSDLYPGSTGATAFTSSTVPHSLGYAGNAQVSVTNITSLDAGVVYRAACSLTPWVTFETSFAADPPMILQIAARTYGALPGGLRLQVAAVGMQPWGRFEDGATAVDVAMVETEPGVWTAAETHRWIPDLSPPADAQTVFRYSFNSSGLNLADVERTWSWGAKPAVLDFGAVWPGEWMIDDPGPGSGTTWHRWNPAPFVTADGSPVLVCTGTAFSNPEAWPAVVYSNGGRSRLTSGVLGPSTTAVRLVHWVDVEMLGDGTAMDGAGAVWVGPDGREFSATPLGGWPARVNATSSSALRGRGTFADPRPELLADDKPVWMAHVLPVPTDAVGPWRLRLEFSANSLWRARGWVIARAEPVTGRPSAALPSLQRNDGLRCNWPWNGASGRDFTLEERSGPQEAWDGLATFSVPETPADFLVPAGTLAALRSPGITTRHEWRVTGSTPWGMMATAPVTYYADGGAGALSTLGVPWPNPSASEVRFVLEIPAGQRAVLRIYDLRGRRVYEREVPAGRHLDVWTGTDGEGRRLPSGDYYIRVEGTGAAITRKVVLLH